MKGETVKLVKVYMAWLRILNNYSNHIIVL